MKKENDLIIKEGRMYEISEIGKINHVIFKNFEALQKSVLSTLSSEELLHEVHKRRDIYIEGWYNADHINENTGLPMHYCLPFIKWAGDKHISDDLESAVEQWLSYTKDALKEEIEGHFSGARWEELYKNFHDMYSIEYDCDLGFYPYISQELFLDKYIELRVDLRNYYEPHQGNIKTFLEDIMNEWINEYFSF